MSARNDCPNCGDISTELATIKHEISVAMEEYDAGEADAIERLRGVEQDAAEWVEERTRRLRADNERLRAALQPFAIASDSYDDDPPTRVIASKRGSILSVYDLRAAKAALG